MKKIFYLYSKSLLSKLALVAILVIGGGNSAWAQKTISGEGYFYGFETSLATEGWTTYNLQSGNYNSGLYNSSIASHTGNNSFRFYSNENPPQYLISPLLAESENAVVVSLYYKNALSKNTESFCVGYTTVSSTPSTTDFTWDTQVDCKSSTYALYEHTFPANTRFIAIKSTTTTASANISNNYYLMIDDITIVEDDPYKTPTSFALSSYDATSATFSWTAGNSETTWQFDYSTNADFTPGEGINGTSVSITDNPYTLTGLTTGTTYYAAIRADYGSGNYSDWTDKVEFIPRAESEITINDGTNTNSNVPFSGNACNGITNSQFIIPSSSLSAVANRQITKLTFYSNNASRSWSTAEFEVYMKETSNTTYGSAAYDSWGTCVLNSATLSVADNLLTIELNTPFNYQGGNLQIGFKISKTGSSSYNSFYGVTGSTYTAVYGTGTSSETKYRAQFLPKMTITSVPITTDPVQMGLNGYTTFASPRALDLANLPSGLKAYKASTIDGTWVKFSEINDVVVANTGILLEGNASETYNIPVATTSGNDISDSNLFKVNSTGGTFTAESGYTYYGMIKATSAADPIVFGTFAPGSVAIPTNRAYLKVANASGSRLTCVFDNGGTTGVQTVNAEPLTVNQYFDLQGRRVAQPTRGLYIVNGKKVVIK